MAKKYFCLVAMLLCFPVIMVNAQGSITDIDGNVYPTITIGEQEWMGKNLRVSHYTNGDPILHEENHTVWQTSQEGLRTWYNNDPDNEEPYGMLYNWHATTDERGLCPAGWRTPTDADWQQLLEFIDPNHRGNNNPAGTKLKSRRQQNSPLGAPWDTHEHPRWDSHGYRYGTDDFDFNALPGGNYTMGNAFVSKGQHAYFWSSTPASHKHAWARIITFNMAGMNRSQYLQQIGFSVRCIRGEVQQVQHPQVNTLIPSEVTSTTTMAGGEVNSEGGGAVTARGLVWGQNPNPSLSQNEGQRQAGSGPGTFTAQITELEPATTYWVRAWASNEAGTAYGTQKEVVTPGTSDEDDEDKPEWTPCPGMPTVTDIDGNTYTTVLIGNQCWLRENLKTKRYNDGSPVTSNLTDAQWEATTEGAYRVYPYTMVEGIESEEEMLENYGILYNWFAPTDERGLCPAGWRLPDDDDWNNLFNYMKNTYPHINDDNIANALKSKRQVNTPLGGGCATHQHPRWDEDNEAGNFGTDEFGFSALPGGEIFFDGYYFEHGTRGFWWSASEQEDMDDIYDGRHIRFEHWLGGIQHLSYPKQMGMSVRCLKIE